MDGAIDGSASSGELTVDTKGGAAIVVGLAEESVGRRRGKAPGPPQAARRLTVLAGQNRPHPFETLPNVVRDTADLRVAGQLQYRDRVHEHDDETTAGLFAHDHIAWQQRSNIRLGAERAPGKRRIAGAENSIRSNIDAELGLHGGLNVDIGKDSEALAPERCNDSSDGVPEAQVMEVAVEAVPRSRGRRLGLRGGRMNLRWVQTISIHAYSPWRDPREIRRCST
jgi:hypothetical protein